MFTMSVKPAAASSSQARCERIPDWQPTTSFASFLNFAATTRANSALGCMPIAPRVITGTLKAPTGWPASNSSTVRTSR